MCTRNRAYCSPCSSDLLYVAACLLGLIWPDYSNACSCQLDIIGAETDATLELHPTKPGASASIPNVRQGTVDVREHA